IDKIYDEVAPTGPDALATITREPMGVVGAIVPWNYPLLMAAWKIGPILAAGNSFVLKPSEKSPLTAIRVAQLAVEAGIPEGVFNVVPGLGQTAGKALALHMDVDCIAFTGSTATGRNIMQYAGQSNMKRISLECGGKSPNIVLADAPNLDIAARRTAFGIWFNQGEVCTAGSRLIVEDKIKDSFLEKVMAIGQKMMPGDPLDPKTQMGAMVDETQTKRVMGYIEAGQKEGATLKMGGKQVHVDNAGSFIEPTVFDGVDNKMNIAQEEIFGPVLSVIPVKDAEQALAVANDTIYGLASAIFTSDINKAFKFAKGLRAGSVWVNTYDGGDITTPFGGYKQSGIGRDKSLHAFDKFTQVKTTWIQLG
ncbi:MAG TPA: aldehyde dehydrogenase family protein, partial [Reyranella sp.]